ncbi:MAG: hypothetical protein ACI4SY_01150, partial [Sutterella sp.]
MTKIQFDSNLLPVLDAAAARSAHCGLGAVPFIAFFDALLTEPSYMSLVLQLTHCDAAAVKTAVRAAAEKALPGFGEDAPAIADDEKIELDQRVVSVLLNAALHTYGCSRENGIIDFVDILAAALSALESSRSPLAKTLSDAGLTGLAVKLIDREVHEKDGLIDSLKLTGCDLLEEDLREMTGETEPSQDEDDEKAAAEESSSEAVPSDDMEEYREAMKKALENFSNSPLGEMIREIAQRQGGEGQLSASFIVDKNGNFVQAGESSEALRGLFGARPSEGREAEKDRGPSRA